MEERIRLDQKLVFGQKVLKLRWDFIGKGERNDTHIADRDTRSSQSCRLRLSQMHVFVVFSNNNV